MHFSLERLEARETPATVTLANGTLSAVGQPSGSVIQVSQPDPTTIRVLADGDIFLFPSASVTSLTLLGGVNGKNDISNLTSLPSTILGGNKSDVLQGGSGPDVILPGGGKDRVYDIVGVNQVFGAGGGKDILFVSASNLTTSDVKDQVVSFFGDGRGPGSGQIQLVGGVLYLTPSDASTATVITATGKAVSVVTNYQGVSRTDVFLSADVDFVGYFGGRGDDTYTNDTKISEVAYGGLGGDDVLLGGVGDTSFLKGGGGNDTIVGRAKFNDLSGNAGSDLVFSLAGKSVFRLDAFDLMLVRKKNDLVLI